MCDNCPSKTVENKAEWTRETSKPTGERPLPVPSGQIELDDIGTYPGLLTAIHKFAVRLARQAEDLDKQVKSFSMPAASQHDILASTVENFVYTIVKVKENQLRAYEKDRTQAAIDAAVKEAEETILFEITGDLYEIADQDEKPKKVWDRHRKYLDRLAKLKSHQPQEKK